MFGGRARVLVRRTRMQETCGRLASSELEKGGGVLGVDGEARVAEFVEVAGLGVERERGERADAAGEADGDEGVSEAAHAQALRFAVVVRLDGVRLVDCGREQRRVEHRAHEHRRQAEPVDEKRLSERDRDSQHEDACERWTLPRAWSCLRFA